MGVDCNVFLPDRVRLRDVANVLGALAGLEVIKRPLDDHSWYADAQGITYRTYPEVPEMVTIEFEEPTGERRSIYYHFESVGPGESTCRTVSMRSRARNIAYGVALVDFFGGSVDFDDCDDTRENHMAYPPLDIRAEDGELWQSLQSRMLAVQPVSDDTIAKYAHVAAYGNR